MPRELSSDHARRRLAEINLQFDKLHDESNSLKTLLVSRTTPKYHIGQILRYLNDHGNQKNVEVLELYPTPSGWRYFCNQALQIRAYKKFSIEEKRLHDINLKSGELLLTSPKHCDHPTNKKAERKQKKVKTVPLTPELEAKINALL